MDQNGNPLNDLTAANFRVFEKPNYPPFDFRVEAVITDVRYVSEGGGVGSISVVLCLDRSGSMSGQPDADLRVAANAFVDLMNPGDLAEVINFSSSVYVDQPFTSDKSLLKAAITKYIGSSTALYDAVYKSIQDASGQSGRKAVISMTDGCENASSHSLTDIANLSSTALVPVYTIGLGGLCENVLIQMASDTGGVYYPAPSSSDLLTIYQKISKSLSNQIRICYISPLPLDLTPDVEREVWVYLTNYPPLTHDGIDIQIYHTTYWK
jgi:VWFA-related protein